MKGMLFLIQLSPSFTRRAKNDDIFHVLYENAVGFGVHLPLNIWQANVLAQATWWLVLALKRQIKDHGDNGTQYTPFICIPLWNDQFGPSTSPPPPPGNSLAFHHLPSPGRRTFDTEGLPGDWGFELCLGGVGNLNLKCQVYTFRLVRRNTRDSLSMDEFKGIMPLLWAIGTPIRVSTNFAVFSKVCIENLIECK